jgi:hypothetical protein
LGRGNGEVLTFAIGVAIGRYIVSNAIKCSVRDHATFAGCCCTSRSRPAHDDT